MRDPTFPKTETLCPRAGLPENTGLRLLTSPAQSEAEAVTFGSFYPQSRRLKCFRQT